jgi:hypothetical protein
MNALLLIASLAVPASAELAPHLEGARIASAGHAPSVFDGSGPRPSSASSSARQPLRKGAGSAAPSSSTSGKKGLKPVEIAAIAGGVGGAAAAVGLPFAFIAAGLSVSTGIALGILIGLAIFGIAVAIGRFFK